MAEWLLGELCGRGLFLRVPEGRRRSSVLELEDIRLEQGTRDFAARDPELPMDLEIIATLPVYGDEI